MKKICLIGNSVVAARVTELLRAKDQESEITILSYEEELPYHRWLLGDLIAKEISEEQILYKPAAFYKEQNIRVVFGKKIVRVDFKKKKIVTEKKEEFFYDFLCFTDMPTRLPEMRGISFKEGVYNITRLSDIKKILTILPIIETVSIETRGLASLKFACALKKRGKEVILITAGESLLSNIFNSEISETVTRQLEGQGVRIFRNNAITEVLGEGEVKAVRLKTGKVIASQIVVIDEPGPDLRIFEEGPLELKENILADHCLRTNIKNVFAADAVCTLKEQVYQKEGAFFLPFLEEQGKVITSNLNGEEAFFRPSVRVISMNLL